MSLWDKKEKLSRKEMRKLKRNLHLEFMLYLMEVEKRKNDINKGCE